MSVSHALARYDALCTAVAEVTALDVAKDLDDKAEALRVYARAAGNRALEIRCAEFRFRMRRRMGQLIARAKDAGCLRRGRPPKENVPEWNNLAGVTLEELGIDRKLSMRAQEAAALDEEAFEALISTWRAGVDEGGETAQLSLNALLREEKRRRARAESGPQRSDTTADLEALAARVAAGEIPPFAAIAADPPWHFETWSEKGAEKSPQRHYKTMTVEEICALGETVQALAAPESFLFLWVTDGVRDRAGEVIEAWGFARKSRFVWIKLNSDYGQDLSRRLWSGTGYYVRRNVEDCLICTRGEARRRADATDVREVIEAARGRHSEKPVEAVLRIERLVEGPYLELFGRRKREGWTVWGNQIQGSEEREHAGAVRLGGQSDRSQVPKPR